VVLHQAVAGSPPGLTRQTAGVLVDHSPEVVPLPAPSGIAVAGYDAAPWSDVIQQVQSSSLHPAVVALDALIVATAVAASGVSYAGIAVATAAFFLVGGIGRLHAPRSALDSQGVAWYLRLLPLPLLGLGAALAASGHVTAHELLAPVVATAVALAALRGAAWLVVAYRRRQGRGLKPALIVGPPARAADVARRIDAFPEAGLTVAAIYSPTNTNGDRSRAQKLLREGAISQVLVTVDGHDARVVEDCAKWSKSVAVDFGIVLPVGKGSHGVARVGDLSIVTLGSTARPHWRIKRALDVALSASLLVLLAPVLVIVSLAIYLYDRGPVIYRQRRVGLHNREFTILKFRSMVPGADRLNDQYASANVANGLLYKLSKDPRVTPVGNLIRRLSIDELPQLVNVLKGEMSLVGPRPLPVEPQDFDAEAARRHTARPGITGPWQVAGGCALGYDDMIKLDLAYVDGWSLRRDLWYLAMTIPAVVVRRSAY
jgi:lipopolysaccharide/colanic/teichoic acid biosynthesis glycosyltransferase